MSVELGFEPQDTSLKKTERLPHAPVDIGPGSLLWKYLGDHRMGMTGMSSGILQLMHPDVGTGVAQHSDFFTDPWGRIMRSLPQIISVVYAPNGEELGEEIRNKHTQIKGKKSDGTRYHALDPETFWWPHATFHHMVEEEIDRFDRLPLTPVLREQLYQETNTWYARYSMSTKPIPPDYTSFRKKWDDICQNKLEMTPAANSVLTKVINGDIERRPDILEKPWEMGLKLPGNEMIRLLAIGGLPDQVRDKFSIPWSWLDQKKLNTIERTVRYWWFKDWPDDLPDIRYQKQAKEGIIFARQTS